MPREHWTIYCQTKWARKCYLRLHWKWRIWWCHYPDAIPLSLFAILFFSRLKNVRHSIHFMSKFMQTVRHFVKYVRQTAVRDVSCTLYFTPFVLVFNHWRWIAPYFIAYYIPNYYNFKYLPLSYAIPCHSNSVNTTVSDLVVISMACWKTHWKQKVDNLIALLSLMSPWVPWLMSPWIVVMTT